MSTTSAKEEKPSIIEDLKHQASEIAAKIKAATDAHLETLHAKLKDAHVLVQNLTAEIESHSDKPAPVKRRGRKPNAFKGPSAKSVKVKKSKGKRGEVGEKIKAFVLSKGKAGAKVSEIAAATGNKPANVTAFFYAKGNKNKFKKIAPATFTTVK